MLLGIREICKSMDKFVNRNRISRKLFNKLAPIDPRCSGRGSVFRGCCSRSLEQTTRRDASRVPIESMESEFPRKRKHPLEGSSLFARQRSIDPRNQFPRFCETVDTTRVLRSTSRDLALVDDDVGMVKGSRCRVAERSASGLQRGAGRRCFLFPSVSQ